MIPCNLNKDNLIIKANIHIRVFLLALDVIHFSYNKKIYPLPYSTQGTRRRHIGVTV